MARATPMIPTTLHSIHAQKGLYLVGLKANQSNLYRQCICRTLFDIADCEQLDGESERHGRTEQRLYRCYSLAPLALAPRWQTTGLVTLIRVERHRQQGVLGSQEVSILSVTLARPVNSKRQNCLMRSVNIGQLR